MSICLFLWFGQVLASFSFIVGKVEQWARLLDWVKHNLHDEWVYGAMFVLQILSREYEFKLDEERTLDHHIF